MPKKEYLVSYGIVNYSFPKAYTIVHVNITNKMNNFLLAQTKNLPDINLPISYNMKYLPNLNKCIEEEIIKIVERLETSTVLDKNINYRYIANPNCYSEAGCIIYESEYDAMVADFVFN